LVAASQVLAPTVYLYLRKAKIEALDILGTFSLLNLLIYINGKHILCGKCLKRLTIQYWLAKKYLVF